MEKYYCYECDCDTPCVLQVEEQDFEPDLCPFGAAKSDWITEEQNKPCASYEQVMSKSNHPTDVVLEVLAELEQAKKKHPEFPSGNSRHESVVKIERT